MKVMVEAFVQTAHEEEERIKQMHIASDAALALHFPHVKNSSS